MNLSILVIIVIIIVIFCNKIRIEKYSNNSPQIDNIFKKYITKSKDIVQIGKGSNSKVVYDVNYPLYAFKIIKNKDLIKKNNDEIKAYQEINQHLKFNKILSLQKKLLDKAIKILNINGVLIYMVCSFLPEEGENQINNFLKNYNLKYNKIASAMIIDQNFLK